jgi:hypothetical protein
LVAELSLRDGELVAQGENFGILLMVGHGPQSKRGERVGDGKISEAGQHEL